MGVRARGPREYNRYLQLRQDDIRGQGREFIPDRAWQRLRTGSGTTIAPSPPAARPSQTRRTPTARPPSSHQYARDATRTLTTLGLTPA